MSACELSFNRLCAIAASIAFRRSLKSPKVPARGSFELKIKFTYTRFLETRRRCFLLLFLMAIGQDSGERSFDELVNRQLPANAHLFQTLKPKIGAELKPARADKTSNVRRIAACTTEPNLPLTTRSRHACVRNFIQNYRAARLLMQPFGLSFLVRHAGYIITYELRHYLRLLD